MNAKSYVTMEQHICVVCTEEFDTGVILLDKRLRERFDSSTLTSWGMCPACQKLKDDGYVALVVIDESKSTVGADGFVKPSGAYRTGAVAHLRSRVWDDIFDLPAPNKGVAFVGPELVATLQSMQSGEPKPDSIDQPTDKTGD